MAHTHQPDYLSKSGNFEKAKSTLAVFDAFPKVQPGHRKQSRYGREWTGLLVLLCGYLLCSEFYRWLAGTVTHQFAVEKGISHEMQVNVDVVVRMRCEDVRVNERDTVGDYVAAGMVLTFDPTMWAHWSASDGKRAWSAAAASSAASSLSGSSMFGLGLSEDVHDYLSQARSGRGFGPTPKLGSADAADACRVYGSFELNKVRGNLHFTPRGYGYVDFQPRVPLARVDMSHVVNELSFGPFYPGLVNPLDRTGSGTGTPRGRFQYFLSLVPTVYTTDAGRLDRVLQAAALGAGSGTAHDHHGQRRQEKHGLGLAVPAPATPGTVFTNQYAVSQMVQDLAGGDGFGVPGIYISFDFEPIMLLVVEQKSSFVVMLFRLVNLVSGVLIGLGWCAQLSDWAHEVWMGKRTVSAAGILGSVVVSSSAGEKSR